ncbi:MAG: sulfatase-like hydrolase/transferase [Clostridia bacterium]|nr:sulfatase-like hydrolase/transferase [Clostridia bacterium]
MKLLWIKKGCISLLYVITALLMEIISFLVMGLGVFPSYWGIDIAFIFGIAVLLFVIPSSKASIAVSAVLLVFQMAVAFINEALLTSSGMAFSFNMLNLAKEVGGVFTADFVNWWFCAGFVLLVGAEITACIFINVKIPTKHLKFSQHAVIWLLVLCLIGENAALIMYSATTNSFESAVTADELYDFNDDGHLYKTQFISKSALKKFGFFGFYFMNVSNTIESILERNQPTSEQKTVAAIDNYFSKGKMSGEVYGDNPYTGALDGKNLVVIVVESGEWYGINRDYTPTLYSLATEGIAFTEYYARDKTNHSEAMSVLGSYPVESDPSTKLKNSNLAFSLPKLLGEAGYTANYVHANEAEFYSRNVTYGSGGVYGFDNTLFLDDMPALKGCNANGEIVKDGFYDFDMDADIVKNYFTQYTQKNEGDRAFYTLHMTLTSHGHYDDLMLYGDYTKELSAAEKASRSADYVVKGFEKFYEIIDSYPTTCAFDEVNFNDTVADEKYGLNASKARDIYLRYKRYQAGMMDLDEMVNELIFRLEQEGELDDTAFLFYADHTAYYNNQNYYLKDVSLGDAWNTALHNIPCFLWYGGSMDVSTGDVSGMYSGYHALGIEATEDTDSPLKGGVQISKFTNSFDLLPTVLHLMGYEYNLHLYHGVSMFSEEKSVFISRESGIFINDIYYDGITVSVKDAAGKWTHYDYEYTSELSKEAGGFPKEVEAFLIQSAAYYEKQAVLEEMYKVDYFKKRNIFSTYDGVSFVRKAQNGTLA